MLIFLVLLLSAPAAAATHAVPAGGDLQAALNAAQPGDVVELQAGVTYVGNYVLPAKPGGEFIVLRTGGVEGVLPGPGMRIHRDHAPLLAKIRSGNEEPALATAPGAHHWRIELVEFAASPRGLYDIITLGSGEQTSVAEMPRDLVLDRVYVHGDPGFGQKRGIALNSGRTAIVNSWFEDIKRPGQDTQAIAGWNGTGPYLIENNYIEAAAENIIFGGADPRVPGLVPSDITVRRNVLTKPLAWRGERWSVKNAFELKNARRVLVEGNIIEHVWEAGQNGFAVLLNLRNQDGRAAWAVIEDVTIRYNVIRHAGGAVSIAGHDQNPWSQQVKRVRISHNLVYDIDSRAWGGKGTFVMLVAMPRDIWIEHNTVFHSGMALEVDGGRTPSGRVEIEGVVFRNNAMKHNRYGVKGSGVNSGHPTFARYLPGAVFTHNVLAGGPASQYPGGNFFPAVPDFEAQFTNPGARNYALVEGSAFRTAASDGTALGADVAAIDRAAFGTSGSGQERPDGIGDELPVVPMGSVPVSRQKNRRHRP